MVKKVKWQRKALLGITQIAEYLEHEFSMQTANNFVDLVYDKIDFLVKYPEVGRKSPKFKTVQFIRLGKYNNLYYRVNGTTLFILDFWDNRQDPKRKPY
jgi:plasmid stabilization system protein ParE